MNIINSSLKTAIQYVLKLPKEVSQLFIEETLNYAITFLTSSLYF